MKNNRKTLESSVGTIICGEIDWKRSCFTDLCESPIELELLTALWAVVNYEQRGELSIKKAGTYAETHELDFCADPKVEISPQSNFELKVQVMPQMQIGDYRVDFAITSRASVYVNSAEHGDANGIAHAYVYLPTVIIECDGHDFHERTKEQAARDKKRDRYLQSSGNPVLRFTGSEIYRDAWGCASQVTDFIDQVARRAADSFEESHK